MDSSSSRHRRPPRTRKRSFTEALKDKYCSEETWDTERCAVEIVLMGIPKMNEGDAELSFLTNVVLNRCSVSHAGIPAEGLASLCPNVVDLDLSNNLIESWKDVVPIMTELPHLKFVNLSKNRITNLDNFLENWEKDLANVENLVLNDTAVPWKEAMTLVRLMPHLKELHICRNGYSKTDDLDLEALDSVECLRLNENRFTRWEEIWRLHSLTNLKSLILSGNPLLDIYYHKPSKSDHANPDINHMCTCTCQTEKSRKRSVDTNRPNNSNLSTGGASISTEDSGNSSYEADDESDDEKSTAEQCSDFVEEIMMDVIDKLIIDSHKSARNSGFDSDFSASASAKKLCSEARASDENSCSKCGKTGGRNREVVPFANVKLLCVSETLLSTWSDLYALSLFPNLESLRIKDVSLLCHVEAEDRRKLFLASLPNISLLNGSEVMPTEREKAERHFVRHFSRMKQKPPRYEELQKIHGKLRPLADVDLSFDFPKYATLTFVYKGLPVHEGTVYVLDCIGKLRSYVSQQLYLPERSFRMFHRAVGKNHKEKGKEEGLLEELRLESLPMSRYDFVDGDEIHIED